MNTHHHQSSQGSSSRSRVGPIQINPKGNVKDIGLTNKKSHGNNINANASFNTHAFDLPSVSTNGMKNIEHFIDKTMIEGKQWYRCKWQSCSYSTMRSDSIVRHMRKHTGERPYKCWYCSYATIQNSALKIHMRRHTGERPYCCKFENCGKRFAVLNTLLVHERTHSGVRPFVCNSCNYSSNDRCKLVSHMRKTHQAELDLNKGHSSGPSSSSFSVPNGSSFSGNSSSHSLALVSGAMSPSQLLTSSLVNNYNPFAIQNSTNHTVASALSSSNANHLKSSGSTSSPFFPLNFLTVISSSENIQNTNNSSCATGSGRSKRKSSNQMKVCKNDSMPQNKSSYSSQIENFQIMPAVKSEENSIQRVMGLVDKKMTNNRTLYLCKWPNCAYSSLRSDSLVRHIRSHTGEKPYKCGYLNCNYATIQRSTLNKHLSKHLNSLFDL